MPPILRPCPTDDIASFRAFLGSSVSVMIISFAIFQFVQHATLRFGWKIFGKWIILLPKADQHEASTRFVSTIHAFVALILGPVSLWHATGTVFPWRVREVVSPLWWPKETSSIRFVACTHDWTTDFALSVSSGYMIYDTVASWKTLKHQPTLIFHHLNVFVCICIGSIFHVGQWVMCAYLVAEASTPFLHIAWVMQKRGMDKNIWFLVNGLLLVVSFLASRYWWTGIAFRASLAYGMAQPTPVSVVMMVCSIGHYAINLYWCGLLLYEVAKVGGKKEDDCVKKEN